MEAVSGRLVLAIDLGTTNAKALLVDAATGAVVARGAAGVGISHPHAHQPDETIERANDEPTRTTRGVVP